VTLVSTSFAACHLLQVELDGETKEMVTTDKFVTKAGMLRLHGMGVINQSNYDVYDMSDRMYGRYCTNFCAFDKCNPLTAPSSKLELHTN